MPKFTYIAKDYKGQTIKGVVEADRYEDAITMLRNKNHYLIEVEAQGIALDINLSNHKRIKTKDLAVFCRQFATTLHAGIPVLDSLEILYEQTENKRFAETITDVYEMIQKGYSLSEAMSTHSQAFPLLLVHMVETGEISGTLNKMMESMAMYFEKENKLNKKLQSAITYPIIVSILSVAIVIFMLTFVMPIFTGMFDSMGTELPLITKVLMIISEGFKQYWYMFLGMTLLIVLFLYKYSKSRKGKYNFDRLRLRIPIFGKVQQKIIISRFTRTMSTLLKSGIDLLQALEVVQKVIDNGYINEKMKEVEEGVRKGFGLAGPMKNTRIFPAMVYQMIKIGEDTGSLDFVLSKTADFYDEEVETAMNQMTTMVEPLIIVFLGGVVGFIVVAMILPIFEMYSIM